MSVFCERLKFGSTVAPNCLMAKTKADIAKRALIAASDVTKVWNIVQ